MEYNKFQSTPEELQLLSYPDEVQEQFFNFTNNSPFIKYMISEGRPRAKDLERDEQGRIIVDVSHPHILEDMDYFRPAALFYKEHGCYTYLRPNPNPNSEYGKWFWEEIRRCREGYVRPSDGEWVPGSLYFFLNYCPIPQTKTIKGSKRGARVIDFPEFWEGIYWRLHYIEKARNEGKHGCEISSRGKSKSLSMAAIMARLFVLGESEDVCEQVKCMATAYNKQFLTSDGILNKFQAYIDFLAQNTQYPNKRLKSSMQDMVWKMGYKDLDTGTERGTLNEVYGVSAKDDPGKVRGKRLHFIVIEEFGSFKNVLELYQILLPSVQEGEFSFGQMYLIGTAGDDESDFSGAAEIVYNPNGYRMLALPNVYDLEGQGRPNITFFFPGYINRKGCYDKDGNSDVTKAILEILADRYRVKYNSSDINAITKTIAEIPITPQEAILRTKGNMFPVTPLTERLNQLDANPNEYNDVLTGTVTIGSNGEAKFYPTGDEPIREFPTKDNKVKGAVEIFQMPERNAQGQIPTDRYIIGHDPVDSDAADTMSLTSTIVLDLYTDKIVAEYTGRQEYADDNFELVRALCLFYNAKCMYEQNKKGLFSYFSMRNCTHLLADTPEYLKDKQLIKVTGYGNSAKGINATLPINNYANDLIRNWLLKPVPTIIKDGEEEKETTVSNLYFIRNRALIKELIMCNPDINVDRVRALGMVMLYREEKMILYQGDMNNNREDRPTGSGRSNDPFFTNNYNDAWETWQ
jgi:hypothetical protein